jgi:hypothetical protein
MMADIAVNEQARVDDVSRQVRGQLLTIREQLISVRERLEHSGAVEVYDLRRALEAVQTLVCIADKYSRLLTRYAHMVDNMLPDDKAPEYDRPREVH